MTRTTLNPAAYDDAAYHLGAPAFTARQLNPRNAGTHIGMYLGWIIASRLESFWLRQSAPEAVEEVRSKQITGRDFLFAYCGGRLTSEALNKEAQEFTDCYYEEEFLRDFDAVLVSRTNGTYTVADTWMNYGRLAAIMDSRLRDFRGMKPTPAGKGN